MTDLLEGGENCALGDDLDGIPVQVWQPEAQPDLPLGPLPQHLAHRALGCQLGREAVSGGLHRHEYEHLLNPACKTDL